MKALLGASVGIPCSGLHREEIDWLKNQLTLVKKQSKNFAFQKDVEDEIVFMFKLEGDLMVVPRRFGLDYAAKKGLEVEDRRSTGDRVDIVFNEEEQAKRIDLKKQQDGVVQHVVDGLTQRESNSGILQAGTGVGKTAMGIKTICTLGRRSLICVHNEFLLTQWKSEILKFTNLKEEDIGYLWQEHRDLTNKKIVIGMIQTIIRRDFTQEERKAFGLVLFDEVQHLPAEAFSNALHKFDAKYMLGLSATPKRFDGLDTLLTHALGDTLNSNVMGPRLVPEVFFVRSGIDIPAGAYMQNVRFPGGKERRIAHLGKLTVILYKNAIRNQIIMRLVLKAAEKGRKILVFSGRIEHLRALKKEFDSKLPTATSSLNVPHNPELLSALFVGGMTEKQETEAKKAQVMFCTYQYASEGLNVPDRDCLILGTPVTSVTQVLGRILRPDDNKKQPFVIDILDDAIPSLGRMAQSRMKQYVTLRAIIHLPDGKTK